MNEELVKQIHSALVGIPQELMTDAEKRIAELLVKANFAIWITVNKETFLYTI